MPFLIVLLGFMIGVLLTWNWEDNRFAGIFWRQLFHKGMNIEFWYTRDNGYGVKLKHLESRYKIADVDLKEGTLQLQKYDSNKEPLLVSFKWLFQQVAKGRSTYMLLKNPETNYVRNFR